MHTMASPIRKRLLSDLRRICLSLTSSSSDLVLGLNFACPTTGHFNTNQL